MYSPTVIAVRQREIETSLGIALARHDPLRSLEVSDHLQRLYDPEKSTVTRALTSEEKSFIRNERLLCAIDYPYWTRYAKFIADGSCGGGLQTYRDDWESQVIISAKIAACESAQYDAFTRGEPVDGVLVAIHKCRQIGATMKARTLVMHRVTTSPYTLAVTASTDDEKILNLYERDKRILDNLPWWLSPHVGFDEKGQHIIFDKLDSSVLYQEYAQKTGLAQGEQYLVGHMTEVASCEEPYILVHHYFPAIPKSWRALHVMESTAQGRGGWWFEFINDVRKGEAKWNLVFVPYYVVGKYARKPPVAWRPSDIALLHAEKVHETSLEYTGKRIMLTREQLYWWESEREEYRRRNELAYFLTNYCATLEESFQYTGTSIFPTELIEHYRAQTIVGSAYEVQ